MAVQMAEVARIGGNLFCNVVPEMQVIEYGHTIERLALSAIPILAVAAGLDMAAMDFADNDTLRPQRWAPLEGVR